MRKPGRIGFLIALGMLIAGCGEQVPQEASSITPAASTVTPAAPTAPPQMETAHAFWSRFRNAVLSEDRPALLSMTRFPFKTRGVTDEDPVVENDQAAFWPIYARVLAQDTGYGAGETERQHIKRNIELPPIAMGGGQFVPVSEDAAEFRVGALQFEKSGDRWFWVFAYLDE